MFVSFFFFFQAEDGIRDIGVTGVQTCALPILFLYVREARTEHPAVHHDYSLRRGWLSLLGCIPTPPGYSCKKKITDEVAFLVAVTTAARAAAAVRSVRAMRPVRRGLVDD